MDSAILRVARPAPGVLLTPGAVPVCPSWVQAELLKISPRLKVDWMSGNGVHSPDWALKVRWPNDDPRWEHVRTGRIPESHAFDVEQRFPRDASPSDFVAYVRDRWGDRARSVDPAQEAERIVNEVRQNQHDVREGQVDQVVTQGTARLLGESDHTRRVRSGHERAHPMVSGGLTK